MQEQCTRRRNDQDPRDWVVHIWDAWFDEVYPPLEDDPGFQHARQLTPPCREAEAPVAVTSVAEAANMPEGESATSPGDQQVELPEQIEMVLDDVAIEEREQVAAVSSGIRASFGRKTAKFR